MNNAMVHLAHTIRAAQAILGYHVCDVLDPTQPPCSPGGMCYICEDKANTVEGYDSGCVHYELGAAFRAAELECVAQTEAPAGQRDLAQLEQHCTENHELWCDAENRYEKARAEAAAIRETLGQIVETTEWRWHRGDVSQLRADICQLVNDTLSGTAGQELLDRMTKLEAVRFEAESLWESIDGEETHEIPGGMADLRAALDALDVREVSDDTQ